MHYHDIFHFEMKGSVLLFAYKYCKSARMLFNGKIAPGCTNALPFQFMNINIHVSISTIHIGQHITIDVAFMPRYKAIAGDFN